MVIAIERAQVLGFRLRAQQIDRERGDAAATALLDIGAQDTGPDGGLWALAVRGVDVSRLAEHELATVWTIRGAPHLYRRGDLSAIAAAVSPFSDEDAGRRIYGAAGPLKAAGIGNLAALDAVAAAARSVVDKPMVKGDVSTRVSALMPTPYLRFCPACNATHLYEMPFRLGAFRAGLELQPGTSPPVLQPIPDYHKAARAPDRYDLIRAYLRLLGPATPKQVADYLDAPRKDVKARWPAASVEVSVDGEIRWVQAADAAILDAEPARPTRLLGPYDLFLQARDRELLVNDPTRAKTLWPAAGRPGAVLLEGEISGTWRPRTTGHKLNIQVELWAGASASACEAITEQAERLAAHRRVRLAGVEIAT